MLRGCVPFPGDSYPTLLHSGHHAKTAVASCGRPRNAPDRKSQPSVPPTNDATYQAARACLALRHTPGQKTGRRCSERRCAGHPSDHEALRPRHAIQQVPSRPRSGQVRQPPLLEKLLPYWKPVLNTPSLPGPRQGNRGTRHIGQRA